MLILTIRTDKPEAELGLFDGQTKLADLSWQAHRQLGETIHLKIRDILSSKQKELYDLKGIVAYKGPGSFTGLRIGLTVANTLADSLAIPIVGQVDDPDWQTSGISSLLDKQNDQAIVPEYGAPPHITKPKH